VEEVEEEDGDEELLLLVLSSSTVNATTIVLAALVLGAPSQRLTLVPNTIDPLIRLGGRHDSRVGQVGSVDANHGRAVLDPNLDARLARAFEAHTNPRRCVVLDVLVVIGHGVHGDEVE
jgi:hypothetical protein